MESGLWKGGREMSGFKVKQACKNEIIGPLMKLGKLLSFVIQINNLKSSYRILRCKNVWCSGRGWGRK